MGSAAHPAGLGGEPADSLDEALAALRAEGLARLLPAAFMRMTGTDLPALEALRKSWDDLPPDAWLRDGGRYRHRRHGSYVLSPAGERIERSVRRAHWQPLRYNALHGGLERWFEPVQPAIEAAPAWQAMITVFGRLFARLQSASPWYVEAHQFRIDTTDGIGRPTPEGAHRDGVDFVVIVLLARHAIRGGESRVFEADGPHGVRFTVSEPWSALLLDDARVIHETTPIQPEGEALGWRDTLVLTYRAGGFLAPSPSPL